MKSYEWSNKHTAVKKCPSCHKELEFADMRCPYCGADARTEQRQYSPKLSSDDIQSSYRNRTGAPHQPHGNYRLKTLSTIEILLTAGAVLTCVVVFFLMANVIENGNLFIGFLSAIAAGLFLIPLAKGIAINFKNNAAAAKESERTALGVEYEIQQLNEFINTYNKDKEIEGENLEVFAKLLMKISKLDEKEKNSLEELTNVVSAMSRKLNIDPVVLPKKEEKDEPVGEEKAEEAAEEPVEADAAESEEEIITEEAVTEIEEEIEETIIGVSEEEAEETVESEAAEEMEETEEIEEYSEVEEEEAEEYEEDSEEYTEEYEEAEEYEEEEYSEEAEEQYEEYDEESEEYYEEAEDEEYYEEYDEEDDRFDDLFDSPEEDIYVLVCPKCKSEFTYTEEQIRNGEIEYNCEVCGAVILTEDEEEEEEEPAYDARSAYEREQIEDDESENRLDSLLDDFDEDDE